MRRAQPGRRGRRRSGSRPSRSGTPTCSRCCATSRTSSSRCPPPPRWLHLAPAPTPTLALAPTRIITLTLTLTLAQALALTLHPGGYRRRRAHGLRGARGRAARPLRKGAARGGQALLGVREAARGAHQGVGQAGAPRTAHEGRGGGGVRGRASSPPPKRPSDCHPLMPTAPHARRLEALWSCPSCRPSGSTGSAAP